jgi:hypothetical protein
LITNADPHNIGTVGVVGSGGATSTVAVLQDELDKGTLGVLNAESFCECVLS